jgi:hypothetical protein
MTAVAQSIRSMPSIKSKEDLDVEWSTFAQVNFRLWWLLNLQKIKKTDDGWVLV